MIDRSLPSAELIETGLRDLAAAELTAQALLVLIGAPRLRALGIDVVEGGVPFPERRLYEMLADEDPDNAHSRYNALIRALVSFERAAECAR